MTPYLYLSHPGDILHHMFGDVSSSDEELDEEEEDMDINIEDVEDGVGGRTRVLMEGEDSRMDMSDGGGAEEEEEEEEDGDDEEDAEDAGQQESELKYFFLDLPYCQ